MSDEQKPEGWVIPVWTERLGGGRPMLVAYAARFADENMAVEAVKAVAKPSEGTTVKEPAPLSSSTVKALALQPGEVRML